MAPETSTIGMSRLYYKISPYKIGSVTPANNPDNVVPIDSDLKSLFLRERKTTPNAIPICAKTEAAVIAMSISAP